MEKRGLRNFGFFLLLCLSLFFGLEAADQEVVVEVEVEIEGNDLAGALDKAQNKAFEEAVARVLPVDLTADERAARIRRASRLIKSFRLISQDQEAGKLKATYTCVVATGEESLNRAQRSAERSGQNFALELRWNEASESWSFASLSQALASIGSSRVIMAKMQHGAWWIEVSSSQPASSVLRSLNQQLRSQAQLRLIEDPREMWRGLDEF